MGADAATHLIMADAEGTRCSWMQFEYGLRFHHRRKLAQRGRKSSRFEIRDGLGGFEQVVEFVAGGRWGWRALGQ